MKEIELRDLNLADVENKIFFNTLAQLAESNAPLAKLKDIYYERQHCGIRTIVAVIGDQVIGTGSIFIETKFLHGGGKVAHIEDVAVDADYKCSGIGKLIMELLIKIAKDAKCYKVILDCSPSVVGFYEKLGFKKHEYQMRLNIQGD